MPSQSASRGLALTTSMVSLDVAGTSQVMLGTDWPHRVHEADVAISRLDAFSKADRAAICEGNARRARLRTCGALGVPQNPPPRRCCCRRCCSRRYGR